MNIQTIEYRYLRRLSNFKCWDKAGTKRLYHPKLTFGQVNFFIGENGSGKSTIIDAIKAIKHPWTLNTLAREILPGHANSFCHITFESQFSVRFDFQDLHNHSRPEKTDYRVEIYTYKNEKRIATTRLLLNKQNIAKNKTIAHSIGFDDDLITTIYGGELLNSTNVTQPILDELNHIDMHLTGVSAQGKRGNESVKYNRFIELDPSGSLAVMLDDDIGMINHCHLDHFPSGWRGYMSILAALIHAKEHSICLIEEPETHLHPRLQRLLMSRVQEIALDKSLQLFITTHSPTIINLSSSKTNKTHNIKLFHAQGNTIEETTMNPAILEALGCRSSDILQANGIIWVEGPSDKIYLRAWLKAYATITEQDDVEENYLYIFQTYGGATLCHYGQEEGLISLFTANRNAIVMMDNDNEYINGQFKCKTKARIDATYGKNNHTGFCWTLEKYTIESYLPKWFREPRFKHDDNDRLVKTSGYSKVYIANLFVEDPAACITLLKENLELMTIIEKIYLQVKKWS